MIVYHGSNSNFKKLRISKSLVQHNSTLENEGLGIYFSTSTDVSDTYGKYRYVLNLDDSAILDFTKTSVCQKYLDSIRYEILRDFQVDIYKYFDHKQFVVNMHCGGICISNLAGRQIYLCLDSNYKWFEDIKPTKMESIYRRLKAIDKRLDAYLFTYHIKNIGVIKNLDKVSIIRKERI